MAKTTIYHNPRCSKSRQTLALLEEKHEDIETVLYLKEPPDAATLKKLLEMLGLSAIELIRNKEVAYKELGLADKHGDEAALIAAMVEHPVLIERPIVVKGKRAAIGRPPENVLSIL